MVGDRDTLFEQPTRHFNVAALCNRTTVNRYALFEQIYRRRYLAREPADATDQSRARNQLFDGFDCRIAKDVDR
jgi:hypothetical protein